MAPSGGLTWFSLTRPAFEERGAGELDLLVDAYQAQWVQGRLGLRLTRPSGDGGNGFLPELRLGWLHDFGPPEPEAQARLRGVPESRFTVVGTRPGDDALLIGGGFQLTTVSGATWQFDYDTQIWKERNFHTVRVLLSSQF